MKQIIFIHGGDSFNTYDEYLENLKNTQIDYQRLLPRKRWRDNLAEFYPDAEIILPSMPNSSNAKYDEWVILFDKLIPFFGEDVRLIGHSLGAMFLAKYLHEKPLIKPVRQLHLVAGGYDEADQDYGSFKVESASGLEVSAKEIYLYHSQDDPVVPFDALAKFSADLPSARVYAFNDRNHFLDPDFPEIIQNLK